MASFTYKALSSNGSVVSGSLDAGDRGEVLRQLDRKGLQPVSITVGADSAGSKKAAVKGAAKGNAKKEKVKEAADEVVSEGPIKLLSLIHI